MFRIKENLIKTRQKSRIWSIRSTWLTASGKVERYKHIKQLIQWLLNAFTCFFVTKVGFECSFRPPWLFYLESLSFYYFTEGSDLQYTGSQSTFVLHSLLGNQPISRSYHWKGLCLGPRTLCCVSLRNFKLAAGLIYCTCLNSITLKPLYDYTVAPKII